MFSALDLAKYSITRCVSNGNPISNLQLQKILYYIQKDFVQRGDIAFLDTIEAWQFGPVVPVTYYQFCGFGSMPIIIKYKLDKAESMRNIDAIIDAKSKLDPWEMVEDTHRPEGAWARIYAGGAGNRTEIPVRLIAQLG